MSSNEIIGTETLKVYEQPAQNVLRSAIDILNADSIGHYKRQSAGLLSSEQEKEQRYKEKQKICLTKRLKRRIDEAHRSRKNRRKQKENLKKNISTYPEAADLLNVRNAPGRPRTEEAQPMLLQTITDIALYGSAAHERRQSDIYRSVKTLDELCVPINAKGDFYISISALYLRLLPKRSNSIEGKRHVNTCPVKLLKSQNDKHCTHPDGPKQVCFISQDDKSRVNIGLAAAQLQAPVIMHVEYRVSLPDHDWVVAPRHKFIPSVYAGITIKANGFGKPDAVEYTGPTYIAIRSGKHSSSTAFSHCLDFERLVELPEFEDITKDNGVVKPVLILSVDGGPDENPRYEKVITVAIHYFSKFNLNALFLATNSPKRSCFNRVERRMAPLS
ncbi:hypothetical protein Bhyg_08245, partial [Pseudolycoriella hygida]